MLRESTVDAATDASGALGISSETVEESGGERRTAINAPPAEMFKADANSRNSWPLSSLLRTKTGIAIGKRDQVRRSVSDFLRFTGPRGNGLNTFLAQVLGQTKPKNGASGTKVCPGGILSVPASQRSGKCGFSILNIGEKLKAGGQSRM